jgi:hypothetical protein
MLLLLRYEGGLSLREVGRLLDVSEDAARKRVARAKAAFRDALADAEKADERPTVLVLMGHDDPAAYERWLEAAGARVRRLDLDQPGLDLAGADALVLSGSKTDVHPRTYGARATRAAWGRTCGATCATSPPCGQRCATTCRWSASAAAPSC